MSKKLTYEQVKNNIESIKNYKLLSLKYKNANSKLLIKHIICENEFWMTYSKFINCKQRCPECFGTKLHTFNYIKKQIEKENYKLLSKEYKNAHIKLKIKCDKGHIYKVKWNNFQQGNRCKICSYKQNALNRISSFDDIKEQIEKKGYKILSNTYINNHTQMKIIHLKCGYQYNVTWNNFQSGNRCKMCSNNLKTSKAEIEIQKFVSTFNLNQSNNNRNTILNPLTNHYLELDIYLPDLNKAIEYNGTYWHLFENVIKNDKIKRNECKRLGINLLIIHEKNYINNKKYELNRIKEFLRM